MHTRLPLSNTLLRDLGCLNLTKRERKITATAIRNISRGLQPLLDASSVQDEWKRFHADDDASAQDTKEVVGDYWNVVL